MNEIQSSTGGRILKTKSGLIHYGNTDRFDFEEVVVRAKPGRPTKVSVEEGLKFDFSAFITPVKLAAFEGARVIRFG